MLVDVQRSKIIVYSGAIGTILQGKIGSDKGGNEPAQFSVPVCTCSWIIIALCGWMCTFTTCISQFPAQPVTEHLNTWYWPLSHLGCEGLAVAWVKINIKIPNKHLVCFVSALHPKEIACFFSEVMCRNDVVFYGFVFCLFHTSCNTVSIAADRNFAEEFCMVKEKCWLDVWGGIYFFQSCQSSTAPVTHLLHHTESCCFLLCCWKKSQVPLFWFSNIFTPKCRAWKYFIMNETCYVCSLLDVTGMWSFCLNMAQFRLHCLKMPFSYQVLQKNPSYLHNSYHPAAGWGLKCESGAWPELRDGKWEAQGWKMSSKGAWGGGLCPHPLPHTSQVSCSLSPSSHPQLWAGSTQILPSPHPPTPFLDRTAAKTFIVPRTNIKSKLSLGCKHANNSLWQTPAAAADYVNQLCKSGDLICANCSWKTIGPG